MKGVVLIVTPFFTILSAEHGGRVYGCRGNSVVRYCRGCVCVRERVRQTNRQTDSQKDRERERVSKRTSTWR